MKKAAKGPVRSPLSRDRVVDTALEIIDRDGIAQFSVRRLGTELGCEAMSIYHYFPARGDLLSAVADRMLDGVTDESGGTSRDRLLGLAQRYRKAALRHPNAFPIVASRPMNNEGSLRFIDALLAILGDSGLDAADQGTAAIMLNGYLNGVLMQETAARSTRLTAADIPAELTHARAALSLLKATSREALYLQGIDALLNARPAPATVDDPKKKKKDKEKKRKRD